MYNQFTRPDRLLKLDIYENALCSSPLEVFLKLHDLDI